MVNRAASIAMAISLFASNNALNSAEVGRVVGMY
jgi:hypothetical protein